MRRISTIIIFILMIAVVFNGCSSLGGQTKVKVSEAKHTAFYAPLYVAIEKGYFKDEGLKIILLTEDNSENSKKSLLNGDCDISLMGPEVSVGVFNEGVEDYILNFAQLTQRAGDFLISKVNNENFSWDNLKGKTVIGSGVGSMPEMVFEYVLKKQGIDPKKDLSLITDQEKEVTAQEFTSGKADYVLQFEPMATSMELKGNGKMVAALGADSGKVPYTTFTAKKAYIEKNQELIQSFTNALQKGLDYVVSHSPEETAQVIQPQFPNTDVDALELILTRYYEQDTWKGDLVFEERSYTLLMDLMEDSGELMKQVPYQAVVVPDYAKKAVSKK